MILVALLIAVAVVVWMSVDWSGRDTPRAVPLRVRKDAPRRPRRRDVI